jgi:hypothetical protein
VTIAGPTEARPGDGLAIDFVLVSDRAQLSQIVQRVRDGRLQTNIGNIATLDNAVAAANAPSRASTGFSFASPDVSGPYTAPAGQWEPPAAGVDRPAWCLSGLERHSSRVGLLLFGWGKASPRLTSPVPATST